MWPRDVDGVLQDCFQCTDWQVFREAATCEEEVDLEEYIPSLFSASSPSVLMTSPPGQ